MISLLLRIGFIRRKRDGTIRWPVSISPWWMWRAALRHPVKVVRLSGGCFYTFRNLPGVIKWEPGRMLPRRWGFGVLGLIEFGDRG